MKKLAFMACLTGTLVTYGTLSSAVPVVRNPEQSFLWHTAPSGTFELRWVKPHGATSATLSVTGAGYSQTYENLTGDSLQLSLPGAASSDGENVYELVLTFDDASVLRTTLGAVSTIGPTSASALAMNDSDRGWWHAVVPVVLPIPYGVERFTVDGVQQDTGLGGDTGWYNLRTAANGMHTLRAETSADAFEVELLVQNGFLLIFR